MRRPWLRGPVHLYDGGGVAAWALISFTFGLSSFLEGLRSYWGLCKVTGHVFLPVTG